MAEDPKVKNTKKWLQFSGASLQMAGTIAIAAWAGSWLDEYFEFKNPWLTIVFCLSGVGGATWMLITEVKKLQNEDEKEN